MCAIKLKSNVYVQRDLFHPVCDLELVGVFSTITHMIPCRPAEFALSGGPHKLIGHSSVMCTEYILR